MCVESFVFTAIIAVVIGILGYINKWNSTIAYSNAFFVAGCLVIVAGASSRLAAGQERDTCLLFHAESFRDMSSSEQLCTPFYTRPADRDILNTDLCDCSVPVVVRPFPEFVPGPDHSTIGWEKWWILLAA